MIHQGEVTFEIEEKVVLREAAKTAIEYCPECGKDVVTTTAAAGAFLCGLSERHIFRLIEAGRVHFTEIDCVRVCLESVKAVALWEREKQQQ